MRNGLAVSPAGTAPRYRNLSEDSASMMQQPRLLSLQQRHATLERQIAAEGARPQPDTGALVRLKRAKLRVKDEMERLRTGR